MGSSNHVTREDRFVEVTIGTSAETLRADPTKLHDALRNLVANAIAYEGIDLQTRTCAIHHLDLPWERTEKAAILASEAGLPEPTPIVTAPANASGI